MKATEQPAGTAPDAMAELQEVCDRLASGAPTSVEQKREALSSLKKMQDEIRKRIGVQSVAVDLVRQSRDRR
jgi:hypothetical protein